jgi:hypothetical protein
LIDLESQIGKTAQPFGHVFLDRRRTARHGINRRPRGQLIGAAVRRDRLAGRVELTPVPNFVDESPNDFFVIANRSQSRE